MVLIVPKTIGWVLLFHEEEARSYCAAPLQVRHLAAVTFGKLGPVTMVGLRNAAGEPRWQVTGLYSAADDDPATCIFRPARLDDLGVPGCISLDSASNRRDFPNIGPWSATMAWPLAMRLASPREVQLWTAERDALASSRSRRVGNGDADPRAPVMPVIDGDAAERELWRTRSTLDFAHFVVGSDDTPVPEERRQHQR